MTTERIDVAEVSPEDAGTAALKAYDKNSDGELSEVELAACPPLRESRRRIDKDNDGKLTAQEIADRIRSVQDLKVGIYSLRIKILRGGSPLPNAEVTLDPDPFQGDVLKPAKGKTRDNGVGIIRSTDVDAPGVRPGFYRVRVTLGGGDKIPPKYNSETILGCEVGPEKDVITLSVE